jgi:hypothetical protein
METVWFDELPQYPVRSFTYRNEQVMADVPRVIVYNMFLIRVFDGFLLLVISSVLFISKYRRLTVLYSRCIFRVCDSSLVITSLNRSYSGKLSGERPKIERKAVPVPRHDDI